MLTSRTIPLLTSLALTFVSAGAAQAQFGTLPGQGVRFSTVATGSGAQMDRSGLYQFLDEASMRNHWMRYGLTGQFPPKIDWFKDQVVLIHLGRRNTGGYAVQIGAMEKKADASVKITAVESTPLKGQITTQALTSPYIAIAIERTIPRFELSWTQRAGNGLIPGGSVPPGSTVYTYPGNVTVVNPLIGPCDFWGGDYYSNCSVPGEFWIGSDDDLYQYNQRYLGNPRAIMPTFNWRTERLLAVHLGARASLVSIETVSFKQQGNVGVLWLAEAPARASLRQGAPISPYALLRVARDVRKVEVHWAKKTK